MKTGIFSLLTAISLTLAAPIVLAEHHEEGGDSKADRQDDMGKMEQGYTGSGMQSPEFAELDANGDGMISESELNKYGSTAAGKGESAAERNRMDLHDRDTDGDGSISRKEFMDGSHDAM